MAAIVLLFVMQFSLHSLRCYHVTSAIIATIAVADAVTVINIAVIFFLSSCSRKNFDHAAGTW